VSEIGKSILFKKGKKYLKEGIITENRVKKSKTEPEKVCPKIGSPFSELKNYKIDR